ncbi:DUF2806 domain-containing protein, partial [Pseudomonas marginalis]|uniref:DUF2806 domain-containing protein n=2 Tax=Pseudomonas fluorescens group TaxID=136843 RepID=UPI001F344997
GAVSAPYLLKKAAEAQAYQIKTIAGALSVVAESYQLPVTFKDGKVEVWQRPEDNTLSLEPVTDVERARRRIDYQERKGQFNIEQITSYAAGDLNSEEDVSEESPSEDWITRFFEAAETVSSEEMQLLWGKILAGEVKSPGSYSLKTLDFIRNLNKQDAGLIENLARFRIASGPRRTIIVSGVEDVLNEQGINYTAIITLVELGILYPDKLSFTLFEHEKEGSYYFLCGDKLLLMTAGSNVSMLRFDTWKYTRTGE